MNLSPPQQAAAERWGQDICVEAGPGSGKTRVLTGRFAWLASQGIPISKILAITYTEKAATEIKQRLVEQLKEDTELRRLIERAYVSTIHGFCARILQENAVAAGIDLEYTVLDEAQSEALLDEAAEKALDDLFRNRPCETRRLLESIYVSSSPGARQPDLAGTLISIYQAMRVAGVSTASLAAEPEIVTGPTLPELVTQVKVLVARPQDWNTGPRQASRDRLLDWIRAAERLPAAVSAEHFRVLGEFPEKMGSVVDRLRGLRDEVKKDLIPAARGRLACEYFAGEKRLLVEALERLDVFYRQSKRRISALDFGDLEENALRLLENRDEVRARVAGQFDHIVMDELQDTNPLQWRILNQIRKPGSFFGVGDVNQSIFGFRHADPDVFRGYRDGLKASGGEVDSLTENYRSRETILEFARALLSRAEGVEDRLLAAERRFPDKAGPSVEVLLTCADTREEAEEKEARWIARRIRQLHSESGVGFGDIAVLARKARALGGVEVALREFQIPCLVVGGRTLLESREVLDVYHFLSVVANTCNEVALAGVLRSPLVGVRDETLVRLRRGHNLWGAIAALRTGVAADYPGEELERLQWFHGLVEELRQSRDMVSPGQLAARIIDESGYLAGLPSHPRRNLERFLDLLRTLYSRRPRPLAEVLNEVAHLRACETQGEAPPPAAANAVRLMTIHTAKGLEFPVVFLAALHQKTPTDPDSVCFSPRHGLGIRWRDPAGNRANEPTYTLVSNELKAKAEGEEMRLLYVAMTRAEDHLVLSQVRSPSVSEWSKLINERLRLDALNPEHDSVAALGGAAVRVVCSGEMPRNDLEAPAGHEDTPIVEVDSAVAGSQHDSGAPVTHMAAFVDCPRRYYLAHYLGFGARRAGEPEDDGERGSLPAAETGTQVHKLLAGTPVKDASPEALRLWERFQTSELAGRMAGASHVEREVDFVMEVGALVVRGQIDVWFEKDGKLTLADYKTDDFEPGKEPDRLRPYEFQLRLYALALGKLTGRTVDEALVCFLRTGATVAVAIGEAELAAARETVEEFILAQEAVVYPLREGKRCFRCQFYRGRCPAGS